MTETEEGTTGDDVTETEQEAASDAASDAASKATSKAKVAEEPAVAADTDAREKTEARAIKAREKVVRDEILIELKRKACAEDKRRVQAHAVKMLADADDADDPYAMTAKKYRPYVKTLQELSNYYNQTFETKVVMIEIFNRSLRYILKDSMKMEDQDLWRVAIACAAIAMKRDTDLDAERDRLYLDAERNSLCIDAETDSRVWSWEQHILKWFAESVVNWDLSTPWRDTQMNILTLLNYHIPLVAPALCNEFVLQHKDKEERHELMQAIEQIADKVMSEDVEAWDCSVRSVESLDTIEL